MLNLGSIDLEPLEYLIVYKYLKDNTINTWTLQEGAFRLNYELMKKDKNTEIIGVYKKVNIRGKI